MVNRRSISLLNADTILITKTLTMRLKKVSPALISSNQTADVTNIFISEGGRFVSDNLKVRNTLNIDGFLVTVDIEKAFDSVNHSLLILVLKIFGFLKEGTDKSYFKLEKGARKGDPCLRTSLLLY